MFDITLKNYRCFEDKEPLRIRIDKGFTALVGPNNSGKSSVLRFFFEFRNYWAQLANITGLRNWLNSPQNQSYVGLGEPLEIYCDRNDRGMEIEIELPGSSGIEQFKGTFRSDRPQANSTTPWSLSASLSNKQLVPPFEDLNATALSISGKPVAFDRLLALGGALNRSMYVGPFRNAITEGKGEYYDLSIGTTFVSRWNEWKTGPQRSANLAAERVETDIRKIFGFESLEINAAENETTLQISVDRKPYKLREVGGGLAQFVVTFASAAIRRPSFILIDEPELNLHPGLQIDFLTSLAAYASEGVVFATHSIGLARSTAERIYSLKRESDQTIVRPFERTSGYAEFAGEMSFSAFKDLGFDTLLLVEGVTELKTVQQLLRKLQKDHKVVMIPLGGSQLIRGDVEAELAELQRVSKTIWVLVDSERSSENGPPPRNRQEFAQSCERLGFRVLLTQYAAIENYFSDRAIKATLGQKYRSLKPYEKLHDSPSSWSKSDNWRIAREMTLEETINSDVGAFLQELPT